jgi:hypothetical protein
MPETLQILAAERTLKGAGNLIRLLDATRTEKRLWKPLDSGRSAVELVVEATLVNRKWALTLREGSYMRLPPEVVAQAEASSQDAAQVTPLLHESAEELAAAILALSPEQLDAQISAPFGTYTVAQCCLLGYWNMVYHEGQINYIQTLYGDDSAHVHF